MIETLVQFNEKLMSLPAGVVVMLFAIALGYVLKAAALFPNNRIPLVVVSFTSALFPLVQFCSDQITGVAKSGWHIPLNLMLGMVLGSFAWLIHAQFLKRTLDPKLFKTENENQNKPL